LLRASRLQPIINGTGIVIHTNFGRAPIAPEAIRALSEIGSGYSNLEYDLATGERGNRGAYIENALALLCGAEAATAVNNCAAALVLIVHHFAAEMPEHSHSLPVVVRARRLKTKSSFRVVKSFKSGA